MRTSLLIALLAGALAVIFAGCLRREITYIIMEDGSCKVHFLAVGDKEDLSRGDALPSGAPWRVKQYARTKKNGQVEYCYEAVATFPNANDIPFSYASPDDELAPAYLEAPVTFKVWAEDGERWYEFRQTFKGRKWAEYQDLLTETMGADLQELLKRYKFEQLTDEEQQRVVEGYLRWQMRLFYERLALAVHKAADKKLEKDKVEKALSSVANYLEGVITRAYAREFLGIEPEERGKKLEDDFARFREKAVALLFSELALPEGNETRRQICRLIALYEKEYEVTNDLNDESFVVKVSMPGTIVECNAEERTKNSATWKFKGTRLHDRDFVIHVKSKLSEK